MVRENTFHARFLNSGFCEKALTLHRIGAWKKLKRPGARAGCGGRGAENSSQRSPFLPPNHRYIATCGGVCEDGGRVRVVDVKMADV